MATIPVRINGKDYQIACEDGQEEHLRALAFDLDERIGQLSYQMGGNPGEVMSLLLAGLMMSDEVIENRKETERLTAEVRELTKALAARPPNATGAQLLEMEQTVTQTLNEVAERIERLAAGL